MAIVENNILMRRKDNAGNSIFMYPITKSDNVDGLDTKISNYINAIPKQASFHGITTEGNGSAYTATVNGIDALTAGASFIMVPHVVSTSSSPTLNVNGLGAVRIRRRLSANTTATSDGASDDWLSAGKPLTVMYDGTFWIADLPKAYATDITGAVQIQNGGTGVSTEADLKTLINGMVYQIGGDEPVYGPILWFDTSQTRALEIWEGGEY